MAYSNKVIDHYENPRNVGSLPKDDVNVGTGLVGAPECGDVMKLQVKVNPQTGVIDDAKFKTFGCGSAIASSSLATEWLKGKTVDEALAIKNTDIVNELSLPPVKIHCSVLAEDAIKAAIADYKKSRGRSVGMIQISEVAAKKIRTLMAKQGIDEGGLRVGVKGGGCSGLSYTFAWDKQPRLGDEVFEGMDGAKIYVDKKSLLFLDGTILDYDTNLVSKGFVFNNPNAKSTCGCGSSFGA
jgi:nitrogen fixation NifU-like protein